MANTHPTQPPERTGSWWAVPCASRADFDKRIAEEARRMAASQEGYALKPWVSDVGPTPDVQTVSGPEDEIALEARR